MPILADTHVHIYPSYDVRKALQFALENLTKHEKELGVKADKVICITHGREPVVVLPEIEDLFVFKGFQVITKEKLEVLALLTADRPADGEALATTVKQIIESGGVPVLPWSFGKWWFQRGKVLREYLSTVNPGEVLLGDIPLRSLGSAIIIANHNLVIAGSDPLPIQGEESRIGNFATYLQGEIDPKNAKDSFRNILLDQTIEIKIVGQRDSFLNAATRIFRLKASL